jgi:hypothetical protein
MATKKSKVLTDDIIAIAGKWPKVEIGTHLTVTKFENGVTILKWDDEQLLKEVQEAIASVEGKSDDKTRKTRKSK